MKVKFNLGDAFPSDSPIAKWLIGLSIITNDLVISSRRLIKAAKREDINFLTSISYDMGVACAHYREAAKYLNNMARQEEVAIYINGLPNDVKKLYESIKNSYDHWDTSCSVS